MHSRLFPWSQVLGPKKCDRPGTSIRKEGWPWLVLPGPWCGPFPFPMCLLLLSYYISVCTEHAAWPPVSTGAACDRESQQHRGSRAKERRAERLPVGQTSLLITRMLACMDTGVQPREAGSEAIPRRGNAGSRSGHVPLHGLAGNQALPPFQNYRGAAREGRPTGFPLLG